MVLLLCKGGRDACKSDSGGPIMIQDPSKNSTYILRGITSWGDPEGCGQPGKYGVYTDVEKFVTWIKIETGKTSVNYTKLTFIGDFILFWSVLFFHKRLHCSPCITSF